MLSDAEVLQQCSSGLALKGFFIDNYGCEVYDTVISVPSDVKFLEPSLLTREEQYEFYSQSKRNQFSNFLQDFGCSILRTGGIGYTNHLNDDTEIIDENKTDKRYLGMVKYWFLPTASYTFDVNTVTLSNKCIDELKDLERNIQVLSGNEKQQHCEDFFKKFGTHVNMGPIHYGEIYRWNIDCYTSTDNEETKRNICGEAMNKFVGIGRSEDLNLEIREKYSEVEEINMEIECSGIPFTTIHSALREICLPGNIKDWCLIDLGDRVNLVGIWDILENKKTHFRSISTLRDNLRNAWKTYYHGKQEYVRLLSVIREYCNDAMFLTNCKDYLRNVIISKRKTNSLWWDIFKTTEMRKLMVSVFESLYCFDYADMFCIKSYLKEILHEGADKIAFNGKDDLILWIETPNPLYMSQDETTTYFINIFTTDIRLNILPNLERNKENDIYYNELNSRTRVGLSQITKHLIDSLETSKNHDTSNFIKFMLLDLEYDLEYGVFKHKLSVKMVEEFLQRLEEENRNFNMLKQDNERVGFYLLHLVVYIVEKENDNVSRKEKFKKLIQFINLSDESKIYVESYINNVNTWDKMKSYIYNRNCWEHVIGTSRNESSLISIFSYKSEERNSFETEVDEINEIDQSKWEIIMRLGLDTFYPGKISIEDVRRLHTNATGKMEDIPWSFLDSILSLDYKDWSNNELHSHGTSFSHLEDTGMQGYKKLMEQKKTPLIADKVCNLLDIVVAVFLCCDHFLKQILAQKLYMCHLSVPFLLPDITGKLIIQLWTIRGIGFLSDCKSDSVVNQPYPIISFIKASILSESKTAFLNTLMSDQSHDTFFYKPFADRIMERQISDGLIDAAWYVPSEVSRCPCVTSNACPCRFNQLLMFLNLHGNCEKFENQRNLICTISAVVVIMVDISKLNQVVIDNIKLIVGRSKRIVLIFTKENNFPVVYFEEDYANLMNNLGEDERRVHSVVTFNNNGKRSNSLELIGHIKSIINLFTSKDREHFKSLVEHLEDTKITNIIFDQDNIAWEYGHKKALLIYEKMKKYDISFLKGNIVPLQGNLWNNWGKIEREMKTGDPKEMESQDDFIARLHGEQEKLRTEQTNEFQKEYNEIMHIVCSNIINLKDDCRKYFIQWLTYFLKEVSQDRLHSCYKRLSEKRSQLNIATGMISETNSDQNILTLKSEIEVLVKDIDNVSIDLKHIFREVGQIYEAFKSSTKTSLKMKDIIENLPRVMADLFLSGVIVEIYDGNTQQIPITFIKSICHYIKYIIKGNVFVLAVLGTQSSGKSTLLNAMFGTQFPTNAGLCTRGVNAQLVPLPNNISKTGYEYIMALDSEGLRASGHEINSTSHSHDNELATLVMGISDLTIVNMKGESQTEMNDILQVVAHALLKIKSVNRGLQLSSKCFFIHHNVEATDAEENLKDANQILVGNLNKIVSTVSRKCGIQGINCFSQIIEFNVESDIRYFSNLWQGVPPMATVNSDYIRKVKGVKSFVLDDIISKRQHGYQSDITDFSIRLQDVWKGILCVNFIFCFKNYLEINAYAALESKFNQLKWGLNERGLIWLRQKRHEIQRLSSQLRNDYSSQVKQIITKEYETANEQLKIFFENKNEGLLLRHWRRRYQEILRSLKDSIISTTIKTLSDEIDMRTRKEAYTIQLDEWKKQSRHKAIEIAEGKRLRKEILGDEELENGFNKLWIELQTTAPEVELIDENVDTTVDNILRSVTNMDIHLYEAPTKAGTGVLQQSQESFKIKESHINKLILDANYIHKANEITTNIMEKVKGFMNEIKHENFSKAQVEHVVKIATKEIDDWNAEKKEFELTQLYKVSILVFIGRFITPFFKEMQKNFRNKFNLISHLDPQFKDELKTRYINTFQEIVPEQTAANLFSHVIESLIKLKVDDNLCNYLINDIKENYEFMNLKKDFVKKVLTDLVEEDSFEEYMEFVRNTVEYLYIRLERYIIKIGSFSNIAFDMLQLISEEILQHLERLERKITQSHERIGMTGWMERFIQEMIFIFPHIRENTKDIMDYSKEDVFDVKIFHVFLTNSLLNEPNNLTEEYNRTNELNPKITNQVVEMLAANINGCNKICPFCNVQCSSNLDGHTTECSSPQHYPTGVSGSKYSDSQQLCIATCNTLVDSAARFSNKDTKNLQVPFYKKIINFILYGDSKFEYDIVPFNSYQQIYSNWKIHGDRSFETSLYWKWFIAKYKQQLADWYDAELPDVPEAWNEITKYEAIGSLAQL